VRRVRDHVTTTVVDNPWLLLLAGVVLFFLLDQVVGSLVVLSGVWLYAAGRSRRIRGGRTPDGHDGVCVACGQPISEPRRSGPVER